MRFKTVGALTFLAVLLPPASLADAPSAVTVSKTPAATSPCNALDACLKLMQVRRDLGNEWLTDADRALAEKTASFGDGAIAPLVALLKDGNEVVEDRAAYALAHYSTLPPKYLPDLAAADQGSNTYASMAMANIGTPEAADALIENMRTDDFDGGPRRMDAYDMWALQEFGPKIWPKLVAALKCAKGCSDSIFRNIPSLFGRMDPGPEGAVAPLTAIVADKSNPPKVRAAATAALGELGPIAKDAVPTLINAHSEHVPALDQQLPWTLSRIGDPSAVPTLVDLLRSVPADDRYRMSAILDEITWFGPRAASAGPDLVRLLSDDDWDLRVDAGFALGEIGYDGAVPFLSRALDGPDWRLSFEAARALGDLGATEAVPALKATAEHHWSRAVRAEAALAVTAIEQHARIKESKNDFRDAEYLAISGVTAQYAAGRCTTEQVKWEGKTLTVKDVRTWPVPDLQKKPNFEMPGYETGKYPVDDGWLIGRDEGEFGGELYFYDKAGKQSTLLGDNIRGIYMTSSGLVAVGGLAHLMGDHGRIYRITEAQDGSWQAAPFLELPSAPWNTMVLGDGTLIVITDGGVVAIAGKGQIQEIECLK